MDIIPHRIRATHERSPRYRWSRRLRAGIVGGLTAAGIMAMFATVLSAASGSGPSLVVQVAATFMGDAATQQPGIATVVGLVTHFVAGAVFGLVFAAITRAVRSPLLFMVAGLVYGAAIFVVMAYVLLPSINPPLADTASQFSSLLYHLAFGVALPASLYIPRRITRFRGAPEHEA